jgi:formate dehydrogenase subunit beta
VTTEAALRDRCRALLENGEVKMVVGYRSARTDGNCTPAFITRPDQAELLVLDETCHHNLAAYLPGLRNKGRIAIIATGPTSRSIVNLLKENQFSRKDLHIIGVADPAAAPTSNVRNAVLFDEFIGDKAEEPAPAPDQELAAFEARTPTERWETLSADLSNCIRCYACRQVCPNCYCPTCFVDASRPQWVGRTPDQSDTVMFHIMRAMHMAGRCVECGACARACPMGIDLMLINRKVSAIVRDRFGHVSGMSLDDPLPMTAFTPEDEQEFIE